MGKFREKLGICIAVGATVFTALGAYDRIDAYVKKDRTKKPSELKGKSTETLGEVQVKEVTPEMAVAGTEEEESIPPFCG